MASAHENHDQHQHNSVRTYVIVWAALLVLLVLTFVVAQFDLGAFNTFIALTIAVVKGLLVILWFMHVKQGGRMVWAFSAAAFLWLAIFFALMFSEFGTRQNVPVGNGIMQHHPESRMPGKLLERLPN